MRAASSSSRGRVRKKVLSHPRRWVRTDWGTRTTAFGIIRLPTRTANTRSRAGNRIRASGYAAIAPVPTTIATEPMETTTLLKQARPMRAVRALLSRPSW
jgi:hypothetical protein